MATEEPDTAQESVSLPIFDLSHPSQDLADSLVGALQKYGFLFLKATSLPLSASDISTTFSLSSSFFHGPRSVKEQVPMQGDNRGWTAMHGEELDPTTSQAGDPKEAFNFGEFEGDRAAQPLPAVFAEAHAEAHFARFQAGCRTLCLQLLSLIGQGLGVAERDWFTQRHDPHVAPSGSILRLLYYPAGSGHGSGSGAGNTALRAGAHSDYGSLTLLFRRSEDPGGLEIQTAATGGWSAVPVRPPGTEADAAPPVLVNVGDLLSYWTGGLLRSTVHRVTFSSSSSAATGEDAIAANGEDSSSAANGEGPGGVHQQQTRERYSIAYFCHPCRDTRLEAVPSAMVQAHVAAQNQNRDRDPSTHPQQDQDNDNKVLTATEHLQARLRATYGWKEDEVKTA